MESGCRDKAPTPNVLENMSWEVRQKSRQHSNEILSLQIMLEKKKNIPDEVLQKVMFHPKGVLLWSSRSIEMYQERCQEDIVYLDATGSIIKKEKDSPPFYVYELVFRNPQKKLISLTSCNILNLWPHHSLCDIFPWGFSDRCCKAVWTERDAVTNHASMWWLYGTNAGHLFVICKEKSARYH